MAKSPVTSWKEKTVWIGKAGLYKDLAPETLQVNKYNYMTGWSELDGFFVHNDKLVKYPGWESFQAAALTGKVRYIGNFRKLTGTRYLLVGTRSKMYYLNGTTLTALTGTYTIPDDESRWMACDMNNARYFCNGADEIQVFTTSSSWAALGGADAAKPGASKFMVNFANHLFCAYTTESATVYQQRVRWSGLGTPTVWTAASSNEAGSYDFDEDSSEITGLALIGTQRCAIYKTDMIYLMTYRGLPNVFEHSRPSASVGCFHPYSLVAVNDVHYFSGRMGFYKFDGLSAPERIGLHKVDDWFQNEVDRDAPHSVYGYAHPLLPLIYWVYIPKGASQFTRAIVYNYVTNEWSRRSEFQHSALGTHYRTSGLTIDTLNTVAATIDDLINVSPTIDRLGGVLSEPLMLSGNESGYVFLHGFKDDGAGTALNGIAETGDLYFGSLQQFKRTNRTVVQMDTPLPLQTVRFEIIGKEQASDPGTTQVDVALTARRRADGRTHAKLHRFRMSTAGFLAVSGFSTMAKNAGWR